MRAETFSGVGQEVLNLPVVERKRPFFWSGMLELSRQDVLQLSAM